MAVIVYFLLRGNQRSTPSLSERKRKIGETIIAPLKIPSRTNRKSRVKSDDDLRRCEKETAGAEQRSIKATKVHLSSGAAPLKHT